MALTCTTSADGKHPIGKLLHDMEALVSDLSKKIYSRAYISEKVFQDYDLAKKLYEIVIAMPAFEKNPYPTQVRERIEDLQK